jgi:hypothetical protein
MRVSIWVSYESKLRRISSFYSTGGLVNRLNLEFMGLLPDMCLPLKTAQNKAIGIGRFTAHYH